MAENPSNGNFTNYGIILATLLSASALLFPGFPALNTRPQNAVPPVRETASAQDIDARLWQDPFGVVARAITSRRPSDSCSEDIRHCNRPIDQLRKAGSVGAIDDQWTYVGVSLPGAPYPEDEESRRQVRYAAVSGLDAQGYVPENAQGIGYFRIEGSTVENGKAPHLPLAIPFELFVPRNAEPAKKKIVLLWLNEDLSAGRPMLYYCRLLTLLGLEERGMQVVGPRSSDTLRSLVTEARLPDGPPKECQNASKGLDQSRFYAYAATVADSALLSGSESTGSRALHRFLDQKRIHLFRTVATDDLVARALVGELKRRGVDPEATQKSGLAHQHIVLISEWDTLYGQTFPGTLQDCFRSVDPAKLCDHATPDPPWVHKYTYLRGLDGALPRNQPEKPQDKAADNAQDDAKDKSEKKTTNTNPSDLPFGNGQFDYLRRLAGSIRSLQDELQEQKEPGAIKAIGVLGTDVFDKLQVLRALKFEFPDAVFFTTDFDENFTMDKDRKWARNLIIASSFGPELAKKLQVSIPPFRQSYQTAAFLSTQLAVMDALKPLDPDTEQARLEQWLQTSPPIFEIGRSGNPLQMPRAVQIKDEDKACSGPEQLQVCNDILPPGSALYTSLKFPVRVGMAILMALGLAFPLYKAFRYIKTLMILQKDSHRHQRFRWPNFADFTFLCYAVFFLMTSILGAFLIILVLDWPEIAERLTEHGLGEPMLLLEGASLWPSIALRLVTMVLSVAFIFLVWDQLEANLNWLSEKIEMGARPRQVIRQLNNDKNNINRNFLFKIWDIFFKNPSDEQGSRKVYSIDRYWRKYVYKNRPFARFARVCTCVCIMFASAFLLFAIFGFPNTQGRGAAAIMNWSTVTIYEKLTLIDVVLMHFLIFLVADATLFSFLFIRQLAKGPTLWPEKTRLLFMDRLGLASSAPPEKNQEGDPAKGESLPSAPNPSTTIETGHTVLDDWIDLYFISKRTDCINRLIYYPFTIIALMVVSRSAIFGDFPVSKPILITQGISLAIVVGCAIALNHAAEKARALAQRHLMDEIVKTRGSPESPLSGQWECLLDRVNALREGAFMPFWQQPVFGAVLLPLGGVGWSTLLEKGLLGQ
jgi:hypothetical protein